MILRNFRRDESGAVVVEFALVVPFFMLMVFGIIDFSRAYYALNNINSALREGARYASTLPAGTGIESTVDVRRNESLVISGLFNNERERVRTGIPILMDIPLLGNLFSSTRWQNSQSELLVVVTPVIVDPMRPRAQDVIRVKPDTTLPAHEPIRERLENPGEGAPSRERQRDVERPLPSQPPPRQPSPPSQPSSSQPRR